MSEVLAIVQARMGSTRLPGKSLANVGNEPMLSLLLQRLGRSRNIDHIVVATTTDELDDDIEINGHGLGVRVHRGSRDDVLSRFLDAVSTGSDPLVRITADCPLIDPAIVDDAIDLFRATSNCSYASNIEPRTYPDGLDVEVISSSVLREIGDETKDPHDREHVTSAIRRDLKRFDSVTLLRDEPLNGLRWTVDTKEDLDFVRAVVARLGSRRYSAGMREILEAIRTEPSLADFGGRRG